MTPEELLERFHREVRLAGADVDPDHVVEQDGPIRREYPADPARPGAMIECPDGLPDGLPDGMPEGLPDGRDEADRWIARQRDFFTGRGQAVEWKTYGYDRPADLSARLAAYGFEPQEEEVVLLGEAAGLVHEVALPDGLTLREVTTEQDWERVRAFMDRIYGPADSWRADALRDEQRRRPGVVHPLVVDGGDEGGEGDSRDAVRCYAVLALTPGCPFAGFWGGTTDPAWRGRGLYRATVAHRARVALAHGVPLVRVDTSPMSRPVLRRLGLHAVTTTTPHLLRPARPERDPALPSTMR